MFFHYTTDIEKAFTFPKWGTGKQQEKIRPKQDQNAAGLIATLAAPCSVSRACNGSSEF